MGAGGHGSGSPDFREGVLNRSFKERARGTILGTPQLCSLFGSLVWRVFSRLPSLRGLLTRDPDPGPDLGRLRAQAPAGLVGGPIPVPWL